MGSAMLHVYLKSLVRGCFDLGKAKAAPLRRSISLREKKWTNRKSSGNNGKEK